MREEVEVPTTEAAPLLSIQQVQDAFRLTQGDDSFTLKLSIPESFQDSTLQALNLDPLDAQIRQVYFFDTPDLALNRAGLVLRARRVQGKKSDSVVKMRPVDPALVSKDTRKSPSFGIEVDALAGGYVCSGSMKGVLDKHIVREAASGSIPLRKLFSRKQRAFFAEHAPEGIELDSLSMLGPIPVLKLRFVPEELKRRFVVELWFYPDGSRSLELSTKCLPSKGLNTALHVRAFLAERGIEISEDQQTKTKTTLEYFSKALPSQAKEVEVTQAAASRS